MSATNANEAMRGWMAQAARIAINTEANASKMRRHFCPSISATERGQDTTAYCKLDITRF